MSIRWTVRATKRYAGPVGAAGPNETDLLAGIAASGDLQSSGKELQRAVRGPPKPYRGAVYGLTHLVVDRDRDVASGWSSQR